MAEVKKRPGTGGQRPVGLRRAMSAIQRPTSGRPMSSTRPRRPYSAYTRKGDEEEGPKFEAPQTNREWWRSYLKVHSIIICVCYIQAKLCIRRRQYLEPTARKVSWTIFAGSRAPIGLETLHEPSLPVTRGSSEQESSCCPEPTRHRTSCMNCPGGGYPMVFWT